MFALSKFMLGKSLTIRSGLPIFASVKCLKRPMLSVSSHLSSKLQISGLRTSALFSNEASAAQKGMFSFLTEEINEEKSQLKQLPDIPGFNVDTNGAEVSLTKEVNGNTVMIKFNVNQSVETDIDDDSGQGNMMDESMQAGEEAMENRDAPPAGIQSKPDMTITISKPDKTTIWLHCIFTPEDDTYPDDMEEDVSVQPPEVFGIDEIAVLKDGKWTDETYSVNTSVFDRNMYDFFRAILSQHGVDDTLAARVIEFSSAYEHRQYINLLEKVKTAFVK